MKSIFNFPKPKLNFDNIKSGDFMALRVDFDEFNKLIRERMEEVDQAFKEFEEKLPDKASYAIIPGVDSIFRTNNKELLKKMIDLIIEAYNNHFNDIYLPYID